MSARTKPHRLDLYDLRRDDLRELLASWSFGDHYASRIWQGLYRHQAGSLRDLGGLRPDLLIRLQAETSLNQPSLKQEMESADRSTRKFLLELEDGQTVETVLMRYPGRATACVSTQVGCAMGCVFCATGQMGYLRNLSAGEIVGQILHVIRALSDQGESLRNVVLMGMGEPLHNFDATMRALDILTDDTGLAIGPRYLTLSTVGLPDGIRRMAHEGPPVNLAVSLHAATDEARSALVPINRRWPLRDVVDACRYYIARRGRRIFFEWAVIAGQNDSAEQAYAVGRLLRGLDAHVNLIPLNPTSGYRGQPSDGLATQRLQHILSEYGLPSTVRQRRGLDIGAGCGQLRSVDVSAARLPKAVH